MQLKVVQRLVGLLILLTALTAGLAWLLSGRALRPVERIRSDVARIVGRLCTGRSTPRDLVALGLSLGGIDHLLEILKGPPAFAGHARRLRRFQAVSGLG